MPFSVLTVVTEFGDQVELALPLNVPSRELAAKIVRDPGKTIRPSDIFALYIAVRAAEEFGVGDVTVAGGVSANSLLRARLREETSRLGLRLFHPKLEYCMDNAAMIAYTGWLKLALGESSPFDLPVVPNLASTQTA